MVRHGLYQVEFTLGGHTYGTRFGDALDREQARGVVGVLDAINEGLDDLPDLEVSYAIRGGPKGCGASPFGDLYDVTRDELFSD